MNDHQLALVLAGQAMHQEALEAARRASDRRALAIYRAHEEGASYRALAKVLRMSHPAVVQLVQKGAALSGSCPETSKKGKR